MGSIGIYTLLALGIGLACGLIANVITRIVRNRRAAAAQTADDFDEEDYTSNFLMFSLGFTLVAFIVLCFTCGVFSNLSN